MGGWIKIGPKAHYHFSGDIEVFLLAANGRTQFVLFVFRKKKKRINVAKIGHFCQIFQKTIRP